MTDLDPKYRELAEEVEALRIGLISDSHLPSGEFQTVLLLRLCKAVEDLGRAVDAAGGPRRGT